jgi:hypothetical protein
MKPEKPMLIEEIGLDARGHLFVRPLAASANEFAYVWRDASGIRWDSELRRLHAAEPARWEAIDLYKQIVAAVHREYGIQLHITTSTICAQVPEDLQRSLRG